MDLELHVQVQSATQHEPKSDPEKEKPGRTERNSVKRETRALRMPTSGRMLGSESPGV
jgi:hypothetical protein